MRVCVCVFLNILFHSEKLNWIVCIKMSFMLVVWKDQPASAANVKNCSAAGLTGLRCRRSLKTHLMAVNDRKGEAEER